MLLITGSQYHSDSAIDLSDFGVVDFLSVSHSHNNPSLWSFLSVLTILPFPTTIYRSNTHKLTFSSHAGQLLHGLRLGGAERDGEEKHPAEQSQQHGCGVRQRGQHVEGIYEVHRMSLC